MSTSTSFRTLFWGSVTIEGSEDFVSRVQDLRKGKKESAESVDKEEKTKVRSFLQDENLHLL